MLKILKVIQQNDVYNGTNKQGKAYQIYSWAVNAEIDGSLHENVVVKAFKHINFQDEKEFEYKRDERVGQNGAKYISYMLSTPKLAGSSGKSWGKSSYTLEEYDDIFRHAIRKFTEKHTGINYANEYERQEIIQKYVSTYIISATAAGVKVTAKKENPPMDPKDKPYTPEGMQPGDDKIPF